MKYIYAEFDQVQQHNMQQWWTAQLRLFHVRLLNDDGELSAQGGDAVVDARRLLLSWMKRPLECEKTCAR